MAGRRVLLTVSGTIPDGLEDDVAAGRRPRPDYRVIAERLGADLVDAGQARASAGRFGRLLGRVGGDALVVAWVAFRRRGDYDVVATDGEHIGVPWELLTTVLGRRGAKHVMVAHVLSAPKKAKLLRLTRLMRRIDASLVYCRFQAEFLRNELDVEPGRVVESAFMVDTEYFDPGRSNVERRRMICSAGLERRDYPTFIKAVEGLDVEVMITASSAWSKRSDSTEGERLPDNVTVTRLDMPDFRDMYAASAFVVMPLERVEFQAGITTILEAMAMGRAVVCTKVPGQTDSVIPGETAVLVPPEDPLALRGTIERLLADPSEADRLGRNGHAWVLEHARIEQYADELDDLVDDVLGR